MKRWILLPGLAIAAFGMLAWLASANIDGSELRDEGSSAIARSGMSAPEEVAASIGQRGDAPLPPAEAPLRLVVGELRNRAERGDAKAACRLAAEWTHCQQLGSDVDEKESSLRSLEGLAAGSGSGEAREAWMSRRAFEESLDFARSELERARQLLRHCEGVATPRPDEVTRYWRRAALAGHLPSMRNYAVGNAFRRDEVLRNLPALMIYRREAVGIARQALARGDVQTAIALAGAYSPRSRRSTFLSQLLEPDAGKALSLLYRVREASGRANPSTVHANLRRELSDSIAELEAIMSAGAIREAAARAANAPPLDPGSRGFEGIYMVRQGYVADLPRKECDASLQPADPVGGPSP